MNEILFVAALLSLLRSTQRGGFGSVIKQSKNGYRIESEKPVVCNWSENWCNLIVINAECCRPKFNDLIYVYAHVSISSLRLSLIHI